MPAINEFDQMMGRTSPPPKTLLDKPASRSSSSAEFDRMMEAGSQGSASTLEAGGRTGDGVILPEPAPPKTPAEHRGRYLSGGVVSDVFDILSTFQYGLAGVAVGKTFQEGVKTRASYEQLLINAGVEPGAYRTLVGLGADILLDPTWFVNPASVAKVLGKIGPLAKAAQQIGQSVKASKVGSTIGRNAIYAFNQPEALKIADLKRLETIGGPVQKSMQLLKQINKEKPAFHSFLTDIIEEPSAEGRNAILRLAEKEGLSGKRLIKISEEARDLSQSYGKLMVETGVITQKQYDAMGDVYLKRVYAKHHSPEVMMKSFREIGNPLADAEADRIYEMLATKEASWMHKKGTYAKGSDKNAGASRILSHEEAISAGVISHAGIRIAKGARIGATAAANAEFMYQVGKFASPTLKPGFKMIPNNATQFFSLAGKYVPTDTHAWVTQIARVPGNVELAIRPFISWWKVGKIIFSPAAYPRQFFGNILLQTFSGIPVHRLPDLNTRAAAALLATSPMKLAGAARKLGISADEIEAATRVRSGMSSSFAHQEIDSAMTRFITGGRSLGAKVGAAVTNFTGKLSHIYMMNEAMGKQAAAIWALEKGRPLAEAVAFGEKTLFNYAQVPKVVDFLRSSGLVPFASFGYFASNATARAIYSRTANVTQISKAIRAIEADVDDLPAQKKAAPEWMKKFGQVMTPLKDQHGRNFVFDMSYLLPFQMLAESTERGVFATLAQQASIPTFFYDLINNRSSFTGRPIAAPEELRGSSKEMAKIAVGKYVDHIYKFAFPTWAPSLIPGIPARKQATSGGYLWKNIEEAMLERPDFFGKNKNKAAVMMDVLGIKLRPLDIQGELKNRARDYKTKHNYILGQMKKAAADPELTWDEKRNIIDQLQQDVINIHQEWVLGE